MSSTYSDAYFCSKILVFDNLYICFTPHDVFFSTVLLNSCDIYAEMRDVVDFIRMTKLPTFVMVESYVTTTFCSSTSTSYLLRLAGYMDHVTRLNDFSLVLVCTYVVQVVYALPIRAYIIETRV